MATIRQTILCPACRRLVSRNEATCPWCGASHPGAWWRHGLAILSGDNALSAMKLIISVNVGMFLISLLLNQSAPGQAPGMFGSLTPDQNSLFTLGASGAIPVLRFGRIWSLINAGYLHGGIMHILFNMLALYQLFPLATREYGTSRTIAIYYCGGIAGFALSVFAGVPITIGASAPVCGLIGALLYYGKSRGGTWGEAVSREVMGWIISLALFGFIFPGINNWGHAGGIAGGALAAYLLHYRERQQENARHRLFAALCAVATLLSLGWGLTQGAFVLFLGGM
jgi:rhomboid protease GluP